MRQSRAPMSDNPFAALTAVVAPAILTNASSILALGTGNRVARVVPSLVPGVIPARAGAPVRHEEVADWLR